jgi:hypothetical protein
MFLIFPWLTNLPSKLYYLDPGSGSFLLQIAIAAIIGGAVLLRSQWSRIKKMFGGKSSEPEEEDAEDENDEQ